MVIRRRKQPTMTTRTWLAIDATIDDNSAGFDPRSLHHLRHTDAHKQDVRAACNLLQIACLGVTHSHRRITPLEQLSRRSAHNFAASQNYSMSSGNFHARATDQLEATPWSAGQKSSQISGGQTTLIQRMQTIHILGRRYGIRNPMSIDVRLTVEWHLDNDAMHLVIRI